MPEATATPIRLDAIEFDPPQGRTKVQGLFEIGLVLAGAVSAGAYIAGVLDYLLEALDRWQKIKNSEHGRPAEQKTVPDHDIVIRVITGASGGGMNGAIFASAISKGFPSVNQAAAAAPTSRDGTGNPFFDAWVNKIDIKDLLQTRDIDEIGPDGQPQPLLSLLDCTVLGKIVDDVLNLESSRPVPARPYLADPLRIVLTTGNLRGIRYRLNLLSAAGAPGETGYGMRVHKDHVRFALRHDGGTPWPKAYDGETQLAAPVSQTDPSWRALATTALASGAFPLGLRPRVLVVNRLSYAARFVVTDESRTSVTALPSMDLEPTSAAVVRYLAVDGGTMNNEPIELSRTMLAGAFGRNPREGKDAFRAVVLIDPFVEMPGLGPETEYGADKKPLNLGKLLMALMGAWKMQSRFSPDELALSADPNAYSRFMIAPSRGYYKWKGDTHIACGVLGGFGGFLSRDFRVHDYLLGRRNCQKFLRDRFALPVENDLFAKWRDANPGLAAKLKVADPRKLGPKLSYEERAKLERNHLPIIPVVDALDSSFKDEPLPPWPKGAAKLDDLIPMVSRRAKAVYRRSLGDAIGGGLLYWLARAYLAIPACIALRKIRSITRKVIGEALAKAGL